MKKELSGVKEPQRECYIESFIIIPAPSSLTTLAFYNYFKVSSKNLSGGHFKSRFFFQDGSTFWACKP